MEFIVKRANHMKTFSSHQTSFDCRTLKWHLWHVKKLISCVLMFIGSSPRVVILVYMWNWDLLTSRLNKYADDAGKATEESLKPEQIVVQNKSSNPQRFKDSGVWLWRRAVSNCSRSAELLLNEILWSLNIKNHDLWQFQSIDLEGFQKVQFRQTVDGQTLSATNGHIQSAVKTEELKSVFPGKQNKTGAF